MTRWFNGGTQPQVLEWGAGVHMPGEWVETDKILSPPWVTDEETSDLLRKREARAGDTTDNASEGHSEPPETPEPPSDPSPPEPPSEDPPMATEPPPGEGPTLRTLQNGDVVNEAGDVVGHIETNAAVSSKEAPSR